MDNLKIVRYCPYDLNAGSIFIKLSTSDGITAGAEFKLYKKDSLNYINIWKLKSKDGNPDIVEIDKPLLLLNKHIITWQVLYCSSQIDIYDGIIYIDFIQDENKLKSNIPTEKIVKNVPPCAIKRFDKFTDSLMFIAKN